MENKKLIEVALPLVAINAQSSREKSIRHGHPSTLHIWWARRPLSACRAVIFSSLVDDPASYIADELKAKEERRRLFSILQDLVIWENITNENVLNKAKREIARSVARSKEEELIDGLSPSQINTYLSENAPSILDPFCGGGSIPLEAQRLGLGTYASDLNPVAVLITKAMTEIPRQFAGMQPVNRSSREQGRLSKESWKGAQGLAEDVRFYGAWMQQEAEKRIGYLYPTATLQNGKSVPVIAWIWARTVNCPNPACGSRTPLVRSFCLSKSKSEQVYANPILKQGKKGVEFVIQKGEKFAKEGNVKRTGAQCILCNSPIPFEYIRSEGKAGRLNTQLMAIVVDSGKGRGYLPPSIEQENAAASASPKNAPDTNIPEHALGFRVQLYGMEKHRDLFTPRQLVAVTTFSEMIAEVRETCRKDAVEAGLHDDGKSAEEGGTGARAYADAIATYLAFAVDRLANRSTTICIWNNTGEKVEQTFGRQAIPMVWNFAEANVLSDSTGSCSGSLEWIPRVLELLPANTPSHVKQIDAVSSVDGVGSIVVCSDPPYYDNIGYADLSDFFYIWLRRSLGNVYPTLFSTVLVPKKQELIASPYRWEGDWEKASNFFEEGLKKVFHNIHKAQNPSYPVTLFYALKQSESEESVETGEISLISTGWETMLEGLLRSGLSITATWPIHTERDQGLKTGSNVLASSIVIVCRPRSSSAAVATHREFVSALRRELPEAILHLQEGSVAPVDLAQASIGPGMAIFSRYAKVLNADGSAMTVRSALQSINQELEAFLRHEEGEMDAETRFCVSWFEQYGMNDGVFGEADVLARAKDTSVDGMVRLGALNSKGGKVSIRPRSEYPDVWEPTDESRSILWNCTQHLIKRYLEDGETGAAEIVAKLGMGRSEDSKTLAYRLFDICERNGWAEQGRAYNEFVTAWPEIQRKTTGITGEGPQKVITIE